MKSLFEHFPATSSLVEVAKDSSEEINKATGAAWYLNLPIWLSLAPFFMVALIPTLLADSVYHIVGIFDLSRSSLMSVADYMKEMPEGIKKIAITLGLAAAAITALTLVSSSVFALLFVLKAAVTLAAITHIGMVIKENMPNIRAFVETIHDKASAFFERRRANISSFINMFSFRVKKETGAPIVSGDQPAAPVEYTYFPNRPSRTDIYNNLPGNPFAGMFSRTTATAESLSEMTGNQQSQDTTALLTGSQARPSTPV